MKKYPLNRLTCICMAIAGAAALVACSGSTPAADQPAATSVIALATTAAPRISPILPTVELSAAESTVVPTRTASPTAIPISTATSTPVVNPVYYYPRIAFATGATSAAIQGTLAYHAVNSFFLNAAWNQVMMVSVTSPNRNVYLEMYGQWDGIYLTRFSSLRTYWQGWLPRTQGYIIKVYNSGGATNYTLSVEIPARIRFARGGTSASVFGRGTAASIISYVLYARAGQTMTAALSSSTNTVYLSIYGFSTGQYLVYSSAGETSWTGTLPRSQEYIVKAVQGSTFVNYTLTVSIP